MVHPSAGCGVQTVVSGFNGQISVVQHIVHFMGHSNSGGGHSSV